MFRDFFRDYLVFWGGVYVIRISEGVMGIGLGVLGGKGCFKCRSGLVGVCIVVLVVLIG